MCAYVYEWMGWDKGKEEVYYLCDVFQNDCVIASDSSSFKTKNIYVDFGTQYDVQIILRN